MAPVIEPAAAQPLPTLVEEVVLPCSSRTGVNSKLPLIAGEGYIIEGSGLCDYGPGLADVECATFDPDPTFLRDRFSSIHPHALDVLVNRQGVEWSPTVPNPEGCNTSDHTYRLFVTPAETQRFHFLFAGGHPSANRGTFTLRIFFADEPPPDGVLVDSFAFSAAAPGGKTSTVSLVPSSTYRIIITGTYTLARGALKSKVHDARCFQVNGSPFVPTLPGGNSVILNGADAAWEATAGVVCNEKDNTYLLELKGLSGPVNLRVRDTFYSDNEGTLTVKIRQITASATRSPIKQVLDLVQNPSAPSTSQLTLVDEVVLPCSSTTGVNSKLPLIAGKDYIIEGSGLCDYGPGLADVECATFDPDPTFLRNRFSSIHPHALDVLVNKQGVEWSPTLPNPEGCNITDHTYRFFVTPAETQRFHFLFAGGHPRANTGKFTLRIFFADEPPPGGVLVDSFAFSAAASGGKTSTVSLVPANTYRIIITGTYTINRGALEAKVHDARCYQINGSPFVPTLPGGNSVILNGADAAWKTTAGVVCNDKDNTYLLDVTGISGPINLRVRDTVYSDNEGILSVQIRQMS